jgi:hypothetical protein
MTTTVGIVSAVHPCPLKCDFRSSPPTPSTSHRPGGVVQWALQMPQLARAKHAPLLLSSHRFSRWWVRSVSSFPHGLSRVATTQSQSHRDAHLLQSLDDVVLGCLSVHFHCVVPWQERLEGAASGQHWSTFHSLEALVIDSTRHPRSGEQRAIGHRLPPILDRKMADARALLGVGLLVGAASAFVAPAPGQMALSRAHRGSLLAGSPSLVSTPLASFPRHGQHTSERYVAQCNGDDILTYGQSQSKLSTHATPLPSRNPPTHFILSLSFSLTIYLSIYLSICLSLSLDLFLHPCIFRCLPTSHAPLVAAQKQPDRHAAAGRKRQTAGGGSVINNLSMQLDPSNIMLAAEIPSISAYVSSLTIEEIAGNKTDSAQ